MSSVTQASRHIGIETPLGEDVLLLRGFSGREELSRLGEFELDLLSENADIAFDDIVGQNVTVRVDTGDGGTRYWNGFISRFAQTSTLGTQFAEYRATMVPWLWFLTQTADCRVFQNQTVPDILKQVFGDLGFTDIEDRLSGGYRAWDYCVQYRETDFNFVSRLMEQEGIYYYFAHENGKHTLVLCDSLSKHDALEGYDEIVYQPSIASSELRERIASWIVEKRVRSGKFAHTDYNFTKPAASLAVGVNDVKPHSKADFEIYDYPGEYGEKPDGDRYARLRMEELAQPHEICRGEAPSRGIGPGHRFTMTGHPRADQEREYLALSASYEATSEGYETMEGPTENLFRCVFSVMPSSVQFRPERGTAKPVVQGSQTATVVGPPGEEIWPDEYGRVKVQFHWDREGKKDENSSCWIRVATPWAGKQWGMVIIPRIGHEVLVSFLEGDPDQPLITGSVYNAQNMPPFGLPGGKVVSGMKTNSTPGGGGYNEISMNDTKGNENLNIHAQYNMNTVVENDQTQTIHNNRTSTVDVDDTESVGSNQKIAVGADQTTEVGANQTLTVGADQTLSVGANQTEDVGGDSEFSVSGSQKVSVGADRKENIGSNQTLTVGSNLDISAGSKIAVGAGASLEISAPKIVISADASIQITCGGTTIKLTPAALESAAAMIKTTASAMHEIKGAMVKHNC